MSVMTVFGGIGTVWGPVLGATIMGGLAELLSVHVPHLHALVFGVLVIVMVVASPGGMLEIAQRVSRGARAWRTGLLSGRSV
jgi:branched-chain amino acid transport system permease protein